MLDGKAVQRKLVGSDQERAVSPVIGVILMVAITVILAAVIAAFVLDMGQNQSTNANAALDVSGSSDDVTVTSIADNTEYVYCSAGSDPGDATTASSATDAASGVGETFTCASDSGNSVIGVTESGDSNVIQEI